MFLLKNSRICFEKKSKDDWSGTLTSMMFCFGRKFDEPNPPQHLTRYRRNSPSNIQSFSISWKSFWRVFPDVPGKLWGVIWRKKKIRRCSYCMQKWRRNHTEMKKGSFGTMMRDTWWIVCCFFMHTCICVIQVFLSSTVCVSDGGWLEEKVGKNGKRRLHGAGSATFCIYWDWQQRSGHATTSPRGKGK